MSTYETDFYAWTQETAAKLRQGKLAEVDLEQIAEELEEMGRSELRELDSRLGKLLAHLLKWQYQPTHRGKSWLFTITDQRARIQKLIRKNLGLQPKIAEALADAYPDAVRLAAFETNSELSDFPLTCPWTWGQVIDEAFYPE
ncbi:hypothetical conserved protein [Candidatus Nitrosoglobus terrae]|uniref:Hypothetical conserved protein n=1 Tax=Candidatus Nitrosoglobus terrae TaxID=1630141 RepID=A0A1Q2SKI6_9GAMM|nr:DUF29 domain-containing protein [Candidatus Nitrosoglobus terrae]BAW79665.1 hypothetical conserved protein [Candidatus Nitrosoglobus terrae]